MTVEQSLEEIRKRTARIPLFVVLMWPTDSYDAKELWWSDAMRDHLAWMLRLEDEGTLFAAGPLDHDTERNNEEPLGMYVLAARDREDAEAIAATEPFACAGYRTYQVRSFMLNEGTGRDNARSLVERLKSIGASDS